MPTHVLSPPNASPRLKGLQICQLGVVSLTFVYTFLAAVIPSKHKAFTFSLLYGLILTSITTSILINKELKASVRGLLTKDKYAKYQLWKIAAGFVMYFIAFIAFTITPGGNEKLGRNESGLIMNGVKINTFQSIILWTSTFNWIFMWASLFYSCCMTRRETGEIRLEGEEATIGLGQDNTANDEAYTRRL
ncbi:uncharacterized protein M421DRAFT_104425 [Didymella exigua CBS 183.55]|uniref:Uncharacterized protein n=1 Tax=Didymella exigua CBS 183.55 TaxID=1150837 RepID=A0A6A5R9V4_9PLEO|nr:uncharacterized protein M421DRAFT_104425 [Didymella exigua CBS 183.55]KAF1923436.1 hypothetical protein M421DRAFT_104425 [Didymella exigua CBS 183.55]